MRTRLLTLLAAAMLHVAAAVGPAAALTVPLTPVFDGEARDTSTADGTFDTVSTALPTADARILAAGMPGTQEDRIIMEFDLSGLSVFSSFGSATLLLTEVADDGAPLALYGGVGDGVASPSDAEVATLVSGPTGTFGDTTVNIAAIDVTAFLQARFVAGDAYAVFAIRGADIFLGPGSTELHYRIATAEAGTPPALVIDGKPAPEPASLALLAPAAAALAAARRRPRGRSGTLPPARAGSSAG